MSDSQGSTGSAGTATTIDALLQESRRFRHPRVRRRRQYARSIHLPARPPTTTIQRASGRRPRTALTGISAGTKCSSETRRGPSGSSAASSTPPTIASMSHVADVAAQQGSNHLRKGEPGDTRTLTYRDPGAR